MSGNAGLPMGHWEDEALDADWKEADHPRAENGQFGSGGTKSGGAKEQPDTDNYKSSTFTFLKNWARSLSVTHKQKMAVLNYTGIAYLGTNGALRDGAKLSEDPNGIAVTLQDFLNKSTIPRDTTVYRSIKTGIYSKQLASLPPGTILHDRGFMSTSAKYRKPGALMMEIAVKKGMKGAPIDHLSAFGEGEAEVLFPAGTKLKIKSWDAATETLKVEMIQDDDLAKDQKVRAAGILLVAPDGRALFLRRSGHGDHPGEWGLPGGVVEPHEIPVQAAIRELYEETRIKGVDPSMLKLLDQTSTPDLDFTTFLLKVPRAFEPQLNEEHNGHAWAPLEVPPSPTHPGVSKTIKGLGKDERADKGDKVRDTIKYPAPKNEDGERAIDTSFERGQSEDEQYESRSAIAPEAAELNSTTMDAMTVGYLEYTARQQPRSLEQFILQHGRSYPVGDAEPRIAGSEKDPVELSDAPQKPGAGKHWGYHLILDISACNKGIDEPEAIKAFFEELIRELKIKPLSDLMIYRVEGEQGRGLTAFQVITTSHISFHGDDDQRSVYMDIFSCLSFNPNPAVLLVKKHFEPQKIGKYWLYRDAGAWPKR